MTNVVGNYRSFIIPNGIFCPDFSSGASITLEEYAQKGLEKELQQFQQSIVSQNQLIQSVEPNPLAEWVVRAKRRIRYLCDEPKFKLNETVRINSLEAIEILSEHEVLPSLINPIIDESILIEFFCENEYFSFDFYKTGEIVFLHRISENPAHVIELDIEDISMVAEQIAHVQSGY